MHTRPRFAEHEFRKARRSEPEKSCVRIARGYGLVAVRNDTIAFGSAEDHWLWFTDEQFDAFQRGIRSGVTTRLCISISPRPDGLYTMRDTGKRPSAPHLVFTAPEIAAFLEGIHQHEFDACTVTT
jgi:hypothetical protein